MCNCISFLLPENLGSNPRQSTPQQKEIGMAIDFNNYVNENTTPEEYLDAVLDYYLDIALEELEDSEDN